MGNKTEGRVIKAASNLFSVDTDSGIISCNARKNAKQEAAKKDKLLSQNRYNSEVKNSAIIAGDAVLIEQLENGEYTIVEVKKRANSLIRPQVANVDQIILIVAPIPRPDFFLIDKLIINCMRQSIDLIICLNKTDLDDKYLKELQIQYGAIVKKIISSSAIEGSITEVKKILSGKLTALAGQSAVGKSSLINALTKSKIQKTDILSAKIARGKNTTTQAEIIKLSPKTYIIDTPGFSMLDIHSILDGELDLYYSEYIAQSHLCKYNRCTHTVEPSCKIKELVALGELNKQRYDRYCVLLEELKNKQKKAF